MKKVEITFLFVLVAALYSCKKAEKIEIEKPTERIVSTFAGSGNQGFDNATGLDASFRSPVSLALDAAENLYVSDQGNHCIRKITPSGVVTTLAGNGTSGYADGTGIAARFNTPGCVTVDATGNVYVADAGNNCIRKISPTGVVTTIAGTGGASSGFMDGTGADAKFNFPYSICIDGSGNLIVGDLFNNRLRKITPNGVVTTFAGNGDSAFRDGPISEATIYNPASLLYDPTSGNIYVSEDSFVRKITPQGMVSLVSGSTDPLFGNGYIDGYRLSARFYQVVSLTVDKKGNLYATDSENRVIRKIATDGHVSTYACIQYRTPESKYKDGLASQAYSARTYGIVTNKEGNIFFTEADGHRIRKITENPLPDSPDEFARKNWNKPIGWK